MRKKPGKEINLLQLINLVGPKLPEPYILGKIKAHQLRWFGHVQIMGEDRGVEKAYLGRPSGRRSIGRPKCLWKTRIPADLQARRLHLE